MGTSSNKKYKDSTLQKKNINIQNNNINVINEKKEEEIIDEGAPPVILECNYTSEENGKINNIIFSNSNNDNLKSKKNPRDIYEGKDKINFITPINPEINNEKKDIGNVDNKDINNKKPIEDNEKIYTNDGNSQIYNFNNNNNLFMKNDLLSPQFNLKNFKEEIKEKMSKGYFPLFLKINENKALFFLISKNSRLRNILKHYLKDKNINESEDSYTLYNGNEELDIDKKIRDLNLKPMTCIKNFRS